MRLCIGDTGTAATPLRPAGVIDVAGRRHPARCECRFADAGAEVVVVAADAFGLVVRPAADVTEPGRLDGYGHPLPTLDERADRRDQAEQAAKRDERRAAYRDGWEYAGVAAAVAGVLGVVGWYVGGADGAAVGVGVTLALLVVIPAVMYLHGLYGG